MANFKVKKERRKNGMHMKMKSWHLSVDEDINNNYIL